jgi:hypothetical protein
MLDREILVENIQVFLPVSLRDDEEMFLFATERETACPVWPLPYQLSIPVPLHQKKSSKQQ